MAADERSRHDLYGKLEEVLGVEHATTLMGHLPPSGWGEVPRRADLDALRAATKADLDQHRAATKADLDQHRAATKADLDQHRAATKADLNQLRSELEAMEHRLTATFRKEIFDAIATRTRTLVLTLVSSMAAVASVAFAAARMV